MVRESIKKIVHEYVSEMAASKWKFLKALNMMDKESPLSIEESKYAYKRLNPNHITTKRSQDITKYNLGASFRISMVNYILEKKYYKNFSIAPGANNKIVDAVFVSELGHPIPHIYETNTSLEKACSYDGCIIKSITGAASKGVFLNKGGVFYHYFDKKEYAKDELFKYCKLQGMNSFIVEEYVGSVQEVTDFKFYMFYGRIGLILEIKRGNEGNKYCFYDGEGNIANTGKYQGMSFQGKGLPMNSKECAISISNQIPAPFIRIDVISNEEGFWVGELTAHPGGFEDFNSDWDLFLGNKFIEAKARLLEDLLEGKDFESYLNRFENFKKSERTVTNSEKDDLGISVDFSLPEESIAKG